jgi:hypothetical protein
MGQGRGGHTLRSWKALARRISSELGPRGSHTLMIPVSFVDHSLVSVFVFHAAHVNTNAEPPRKN